VLERTGFLLDGLLVTLEVTGAGLVVAALAAFAGGLGQLAPAAPVRVLARGYVQFFRGTSALVQLFWFYFVLPHFGVRLDAFVVGAGVIGLNVGAYGAEVVRGAITAVPRGQREAARALNLTPRQALRHVLLPQALVAMLPPFGNLAIELAKATALVSMITLRDLTRNARTVVAETHEQAAVYGAVLIVYFALAMALTGGVRRLERRFGYPGLGEARQ